MNIRKLPWDTFKVIVLNYGLLDSQLDNVSSEFVIIIMVI